VTQPTKEDQVVYRATSKAYPHSHVHFGDYAAARAWAGDDGSVDPVSLRSYASLRTVEQAPSKERVAELLEFWSEQLEVSMRMDGARHMRGDAMRDTITVLRQLQSSPEPACECPPPGTSSSSVSPFCRVHAVRACRYSIEPHGDGHALYRDRSSQFHGFNLAYITEAEPEALHLIERALNAGASQPPGLRHTCTICGGDVDLSNAAKPTTQVGPGGKRP
jgi:hypothetical protein